MSDKTKILIALLVFFVAFLVALPILAKEDNLSWQYPVKFFESLIAKYPPLLFLNHWYKILPDLAISRVWTKPAAVYLGEKVNLHCVYKNQGADLKGDWKIAYYLNDQKIYSLKLVDLAGGGERTLTNWFIPKEAGNYKYECAIDPDNEITEINEKNNRASLNFIVREKPFIDLDVSDIFLDSKNHLWIEHTNRGNMRIEETFREKVWLDGKLIDDSQEKIVLNPGQWIKHQVYTNPELKICGARRVRVMVDADNVLKEADETNNISTKKLISTESVCLDGTRP